MSDYCPHGVGMKYPCTQCKDAELADAKGLLADARTEISHYMLSLSEVRAELAAKDANAAALGSAIERRNTEIETLRKQLDITQKGYDHLHNHNQELSQSAERRETELAEAKDIIETLRKRIAELETYNTTQRARIEEQNAIIHGMQDGALVRDQAARIAELEEDYMCRHNDAVGNFEKWKLAKVRAEQAEARVAELDRDIAAKARNLTYLNARAERAEARIAELEADVTGANVNAEEAWRQREQYLESNIRLKDMVVSERARAERAEAERDALLYNAESQYCAGMSAGFELGRNDDRAELSRIITQRWKEIADAKARAALAPSPADKEPA